MPKFKCEYEHGELSDSKIWKLTIEADDHRQAYEKFLKEAGVFGNRVYVGKGFKGEYFNDHVEEIINKEKEREKTVQKEHLEKTEQERKLKVQDTELVDILEILKEINENIKSYGFRIICMLFAIAIGILGIKFLLD